MAPFMLSGFRRRWDDFMTTKNSINTVCTQKSSSLCLCLCLAPVLTLFSRCCGVASLVQASHTDAWRRTEPGLLFRPSSLQKLTEVLFKSLSVQSAIVFKNISLKGVIYKKTTFNHDFGLLLMVLFCSLSILVSALTLPKKKQAASVPGLVLTRTGRRAVHSSCFHLPQGSLQSFNVWWWCVFVCHHLLYGMI